jgi:signal recognition particle subunit SRP54
MGEKLTDLEPFYPDRMASRILGMGDVESLIEKAQNAIDDEKAKEMEQKFRKASFDFNDFLEQMDQLDNMGGIQDVLSMMPGMASQMKNVEIDENAAKKPKAIIQSMTPRERSLQDNITPSRKKRIADGAGVQIAEVNRFLKQFEQSKKMMKQMSGMMGGKKHGGFKLPFGFR